MENLILQVDSFQSATRWDWRLTFPTGHYLADHTVELDEPLPPGDLVDLPSYLRRHGLSLDGPDDVVAQAGRWIQETLLGPLGEQIAAQAPATVEVQLPAEASTLVNWPLELGYAPDPLSTSGELVPLAQQNVSFVYEILGEEPDNPPSKAPIGPALRILTLFCEHPGSTSTLDRERRRLTARVDRITEGRNKAIELRPLMYGLTEKMLQDALEEGAGWDVVHLSGYGLNAGLLLHGNAEAPQALSAAKLTKLLKRVKSRLKLVILVDRDPGEVVVPVTGHVSGVSSNLAGLARELVRQLDCAVLAMRCPASDRFATLFVPELFENLLHKSQSLPVAVQHAMEWAVGSADELGPLFLVIGPTLFGKRAVDLRIETPAGPELDYNVTRLKMTGIPQAPDSFRFPVALMDRASASLRPDSRLRGVLLHGATEAGKTLCAAELARVSERDFQTIVWYQAPSEPDQVRGAFDGLVRQLDRKLTNLRMGDAVDTEQGLLDFLPGLTELLGRRSVLIVLDNLQTLLKATGTWRDPWIEHVVHSLLANRGDSRVILTSRTVPLGLGNCILTEELVRT